MQLPGSSEVRDQATRNRILRNNDSLDDRTVDEVVVHNCTVHLEMMSNSAYWIGIYDPATGKSVDVDLVATCRPKRLLCTVRDESWDWDSDSTHIGVRPDPKA